MTRRHIDFFIGELLPLGLLSLSREESSGLLPGGGEGGWKCQGKAKSPISHPGFHLIPLTPPSVIPWNSWAFLGFCRASVLYSREHLPLQALQYLLLPPLSCPLVSPFALALHPYHFDGI